VSLVLCCLYRHCPVRNADGGGNELRHYVRRHAALALLPLNEVITVLQLIRQQRPANLDDDDRERLVAFDAYFTQQWVETLSPNTSNHFDNGNFFFAHSDFAHSDFAHSAFCAMRYNLKIRININLFREWFQPSRSLLVRKSL
jgi:hypothetical protein